MTTPARTGRCIKSYIPEEVVNFGDLASGVQLNFGQSMVFVRECQRNASSQTTRKRSNHSLPFTLSSRCSAQHNMLHPSHPRSLAHRSGAIALLPNKRAQSVQTRRSLRILTKQGEKSKKIPWKFMPVGMILHSRVRGLFGREEQS